MPSTPTNRRLKIVGEQTNIASSLSYFDLLASSEQGRWNMSELPAAALDRSKVTPELIRNVEAMAYGELTTFSATHSFMSLFQDDIDFTQWISVWFYEETKHPLALIRWLHEFGVPINKDFILRGRQITPMTTSKIEMLVFNIISEITANNMYLKFRSTVEEPYLNEILRNLARDEMRHSVGFTEYCRKTIHESDDPDRDRLRVLRTAWYMLQPTTRDGDSRHPVLLTRNNITGMEWQETIDRVNAQTVTRLANLTGVEIPSVNHLYEVYTAFKQRYRAERRGQRADLETVQ